MGSWEYMSAIEYDGVSHPSPRYLFVDGQYLLDIIEELLVPVFPGFSLENDIDLSRLLSTTRCSKGYFYHALDKVEAEKPIPKYTPMQPKPVLSKPQIYKQVLDRIRRIPNMHVAEGMVRRRGKVSGKGRGQNEQKQVDVLLAVDALTHAFNKNCIGVTILSGDADFVPVVEALVAQGQSVHVIGALNSTNELLKQAADWFVPITPDFLLNLTKSKQQRIYINANVDMNGLRVLSKNKEKWQSPSTYVEPVNPQWCCAKSDTHLFLINEEYGYQFVTMGDYELMNRFRSAWKIPSYGFRNSPSGT
jgi:uncharacterized LabA/DUF88 family protein